MATTLTKQTLVDSNKRALIKIVGEGGTDANAALIDVSSLQYALNANGQIMTAGADKKSSYRTTIKRIWGQGHMAQGKYVTLKWANTNTAIVTFGDGQFDYTFESESTGGVIGNPDIANSSGSLVFSSTAGASDAWTLFIDLKKDARDFDAGQSRDPAAFNYGPWSGSTR